MFLFNRNPSGKEVSISQLFHQMSQNWLSIGLNWLMCWTFQLDLQILYPLFSLLCNWEAGLCGCISGSLPLCLPWSLVSGKTSRRWARENEVRMSTLPSSLCKGLHGLAVSRAGSHRSHLSSLHTSFSIWAPITAPQSCLYNLWVVPMPHCE